MALALVGAGWAAARAQMNDPSFEIRVDTSGSGATVTCVKGCALAWVERGVNPNSRPIEEFTFACGNPNGVPMRCGSGRIGGWLR